ncbi:universal stress protein [Haloarchaeobius sp. DFWS5]|uniref:universal stress protein n=1 Tax=Haloarchaeobius sp. DFWS5 TaxID=3446114 RepID=UPI003EB69E9A
MTTFLAGTDEAATSERLCEYLARRVGPDDTVHVVNSITGDGKEEIVAEGEEALAVFDDRLGEQTTVETRQFARGNDPTADLLSYAKELAVDELVIGIDQKRTQVKKLIFGSIGQAILLQTDRPVVGVPLPPGE